MLEKRLMASIESFKADLDKITEIQKEFLKEAKEFVYFRKGEFDNIVAILNATMALIKLGVDVIDIFRRKRQDKEGSPREELVIRVISIKTPQNEQGLRELEQKGVGVCIVPKEKRGSMRYFVNEKRFCLFIRQQEDSFFGVKGNDSLMRAGLKQLFEAEYVEHKR